MDFPGYKKTDFQNVQFLLKKLYDDTGIHDLNFAAKIGVKSVATVRNVFNKDKQIVSDELFTIIFNALNLDAFIVWINGKRVYYVKK